MAARVYITARSEDTLRSKAAELSGMAAGECIAIPGDLATMDGVADLSAALRREEDYIDVLVNNAGLGTGGPFERMDVADWDRTMDLNLRSPLFLTQALLDLLKKNATPADPARVIFTGSVAASGVYAHVMAYSTSKNANRTPHPVARIGALRGQHPGEHDRTRQVLLRNDPGRVAGPRG